MSLGPAPDALQWQGWRLVRGAGPRGEWQQATPTAPPRPSGSRALPAQSSALPLDVSGGADVSQTFAETQLGAI